MNSSISLHEVSSFKIVKKKLHDIVLGSWDCTSIIVKIADGSTVEITLHHEITKENNNDSK